MLHEAFVSIVIVCSFSFAILVVSATACRVFMLYNAARVNNAQSKALIAQNNALINAQTPNVDNTPPPLEAPANKIKDSIYDDKWVPEDEDDVSQDGYEQAVNNHPFPLEDPANHNAMDYAIRPDNNNICYSDVPAFGHSLTVLAYEKSQGLRTYGHHPDGGIFYKDQ